MAEKDSQSNSQEQQPKRKFRQEQYDLLKRCSEKKNLAEWTQWYVEHTDEEILLEGANLRTAHLKGADLPGAHLEGANLAIANLEGAHLRGTHLEGANLWRAHLEGANLEGANLEGADLGAYLEDANLLEANLSGARLVLANLQGADLSRAIVDGGTLIWKCDVDANTKFEGIGLGNIRIYPETRQLLEYNIRRMNWQEWYKKGWLLTQIAKRLFIQPFWWISNYGLSTWRIIATFFALAVIFATVYFVWGAFDYYCLCIKDQPGIVKDLFIPLKAEKPMSDVYYGAIIYFRSVYFSIVTMTTLGFGDMYANPTRAGCRWWIGHLFLIVQVILGYVLLAALVTRFAVLFTAGGPAGEFAEKEQKSEHKQ